MVDYLVKVPDGHIAPFFTWSEGSTSKKLTLSNNNLTVTVNEGSGFKTTLGNVAFTPGNKYYFEIFVSKGSLIKIGVSRGDVNVEEAFSDGPKGWAIYNGELRHNNNSTGSKYGSTYTSGDTIGVMLDTIEGTLSFSKNNTGWGAAYKSEEFTKGELFAACAPIYVNDSFTLKMMVPED